MQLVDPPHDGKIGRRHRPWHIINTAAADRQCLRLLHNRQRVDTVDHRFVPGNSPALPSAPDKKSFTNVNAPIRACNVFTSITSPAGSVWPSDSKTPAAPSSNCDHQVVIWFG